MDAIKVRNDNKDLVPLVEYFTDRFVVGAATLHGVDGAPAPPLKTVASLEYEIRKQGISRLAFR